MNDMDKISELVDTLATRLQAHGEDAQASMLLDGLYGAATGGEMRIRLRHALRTVNRKQLGTDVALVMELERLLS